MGRKKNPMNTSSNKQTKSQTREILNLVEKGKP